jgi:uncharacterized protein YecE (DUF72 family)
MKPVRIGCSGWAYKEWRDGFYPPKLPQRQWLSHYATHFETVEINSTFYRLPSEDAVKAWIAETAETFRFAIKASRYITHIKKLNSPEKYVERFLESIRPIADAGKLEAILWQLPPSLKRNDERLDAALAAIGERSPGRHAVEFRNESWFTGDVYSLLRERGAALAIADDPEFPFQQREITAKWTYVRFHRGGRGAGGRYSKTDLKTWRKRIDDWRARIEVVAYFNNDSESFAVDNARALRDGVS